jgi:hypothetical protein
MATTLLPRAPRRRLQPARCAALAFLLVHFGALLAEPALAAHKGKWTPTHDMGGTAIHMALLPGDGDPYHSRIVWWQAKTTGRVGGEWGWKTGNESCAAWPSTSFDTLGHFNSHHELFCSSNTIIDRRVVAAGGWESESNAHNGIRRVRMFTPGSGTAPGSWAEVASMERFFWSRTTAALGDRAGRQFVAITDPGTALEKLAATRGYRETFVNPPDIGGRFSALSLFGLVPTALLGASPRDLLAAGTAMAEGCRQENHANAGLELGAFIGAATLEGRDKLTVVLPPSLSTLGLWIEQLVAESTGKHGKGALPVVDEPLGRPDEYGQDRAFVSIATERDAPDTDRLAALEAAGHPVLRLSTRVDGIGAEFFRWEFATAIAGAALGINPFDEPNVSEAKEQSKVMLGAHARDGRLPGGPPVTQDGGVAVYSSAFKGDTPAAVVRAAIEQLRPGDYVAFLSYLPAEAAVARAVAGAREAIRRRTRSASTVGVGPRYQHSTGQYHKGGPNTALAFVITADDASETEIPEAGYSFSVLKRAQALGDYQTLDAHGRRVVRIHVTGADAAGSLEKLFAAAL